MKDNSARPGIKVTPFPPGTPAALPVVPSDRAASLISMSWHLARTEDDGRRLIITSQRRYWHRVVGVAVDATDDAVTVALLAEYIDGPRGRGRTVPRITGAFSVLLDEPIGERELIHAPVTYRPAY